MYHYNLQEWLLFFFIYCFLGWCWESCYVSAKQRKWVNRGFLNGPFLPIYGFGALSVLIATLPVRETPVLVFIFGMLGATALELVTGICMEKLFHVRYWDYSNQKFNYKGHICLSSSLAWGAFSLAMIYGFHKPIERLVTSIPFAWLDILTTILTVVVAADFAVSFKTAMELRDILDNMERVKDEMKRLQKRAEVIEAFLAEDFQDAKDQIKEGVQEYRDQLVEGMKERRDSMVEEWQQKKENARLQLQKIRNKQNTYTERMKNGMPGNASIAGLLKRNPSAVSRRHVQSFKEYKKELLENRKKRNDREK